jgi:hypothetical protein
VADLSRLVTADLTVIRKDWTALALMAAAAPLLAFICFEASRIGSSDGRPGFYTEQIVIGLAQFCSFPVVVLGAYLGAKDFDWGTAAGRVVAVGRQRLGVARVLAVGLFSVLAAAGCAGVGLGLDFLVPGVPMPNLVDVLGQILASSLVLWFWGTTALLFGFVFMSLAAGLAIPLALAAVEFLVPPRAWPEWALAVLPLRAVRSVLHALYPTPRGFVAIYLPTYNDVGGSIALLAGVPILCVAIYGMVLLRREF